MDSTAKGLAPAPESVLDGFMSGLSFLTYTDLVTGLRLGQELEAIMARWKTLGSALLGRGAEAHVQLTNG
jgi:hypothetical protein